ncbi:MAG TPA: SDR family oxidoreductase [Gemmatimonadales bacterium]|nr:SDR family oxidoreductase [Gemmatimonadales bacterium]
MTSLAGRVAVVTGASRGIGAAVAAGLLAAGARVVRIARSLVDGERDGALDLRGDLTRPGEAARLAGLVRERVGTPTVLVNNAGAFLLRPFEATDEAEFAGQLAANLQAPFAVARAFLPAMRAAGGGVMIAIGSVADHVAYPENAAYAASKYGLRGLCATLAAEYRGTGVRISLVSPGPTDTAIWDPVDPDARPGFVPRARMLRPEDVAEAVVFVATRPPRVHVDWLRLGPA